jgi:hypothetical protein
VTADTRIAAVRVTKDLEAKARVNADLPYAPLGAIVRIGMAVLAGYSKEEAVSRFYLDPASKRARMLSDDDSKGGDATMVATNTSHEHDTEPAQ